MLMTFGRGAVAAMLVVVCTTAFSSHVAADDAPKVKSKTEAKAADSCDPPLLVWSRTRSFQKLERAILSGVKLDAPQRATVTKAFDDLYRLMRADPQSASFYPRVYPTFDAKELQVRKDDQKAARKVGNTKLEREIQVDIDKHSIGTEANITPIPEDIIPKLAIVMRGDQLTAYQKITDRWTALSPRGTNDGPLRMIYRAINDPELKLDKDQQKIAFGIVHETQLKVFANRDPDNVAKVSASARVEILKALKDEQRVHFDKTLDVLATEMKANRNYAKRWFRKRGRTLPNYLHQPIPWEK